MKEHKILKDHKDTVNGSIKKWYQKFRLTSKEKKIWLGILTIFMLIVFLAVAYALGYSNGKEAGKTANRGSLFDSLEAPFDRIATGEVNSVTKDEIRLTVNGKEKTYKIDAETKVTEGQNQKQVTDVKRGMRVTVIRSSDRNNAVASKILIRTN